MSVKFGSVHLLEYASDHHLSPSQRHRVLDGMIRQSKADGQEATSFSLDGQDYFLRNDQDGMDASWYLARKSESRPTSYVGGNGWAMPVGFRAFPKMGKALRALKEEILEKARERGAFRITPVAVEKIGRRLKATCDLFPRLTQGKME